MEHTRNLIMVLSDICLLVSFLSITKSLKTMVYLSLGSQNGERSHQFLQFELGAQCSACACVRVNVCASACVCVCV